MYITSISLALVMILGGMSMAYADTGDLFTKVAGNKIINSNAILDSEIVTVNISRLNNELVPITLFDNTYVFTSDRINKYGPGSFTWFGSIDDGYAIITVLEGKLVATINTPHGDFVVDANEKTFYHHVKKIALGALVETPHEFESQVISEFTQQSATHGVDDENYYVTNIGQAMLVHDTFRPSNLAELQTVYVDIFVGYTTAVDDEHGSTTVERKIRNEITTANYPNTESGIPVEFRLAGYDDVRYTEGTTAKIDKENLIEHTNRSPLDALRDDADDVNADILILLTKPSVDIKNYGCGVAGNFIAKSPHDSIAIVAYECLGGLTFVHEIGHLFGAGHNRDYLIFGVDNPPLTQFTDDAYGYYDVTEGQRSIMSYDCDSSEFDSPTEGVNVSCSPDRVWSDPEIMFGGSVTPAGDDDNYNARAIFGSGPYIASMQGEKQSYDYVPPTILELFIEAITDFFTQGDRLDITAIFDETINPDYPPVITIGDTTITMTKLSSVASTSSFDTTTNDDFTYVAYHTLSDEVGQVDIVISNAQDIYGNVMVQVTETITVEIPDIIPPVFSSVFDISMYETFGEGQRIINYTNPTAIDANTGVREVTCTPPSGTAFLLGNTTVTCVADDGNGNNGEVEFLIEIKENLAGCHCDPEITEFREPGRMPAAPITGIPLPP